MAGKNGINIVLILVIVVLTAAGCSPPFGNIGGELSTKTDGLLKAEPQQEVYHRFDYFRQNTDHLLVYIVRGDNKVNAPINLCDIWIIEESNTSVLTTYVTRSGGLYQFTTDGKKTIRVEYDGLEAKCEITVSPESQIGPVIKPPTWEKGP